MPKFRHLGFVAFTATFVAAIAVVFWGAWSQDYSPIMPDNVIFHPGGWSAAFASWRASVIESWRFQPIDLFYSGLFISPYFCQELKYAVSLYCAALGLAYYLRGRGLSEIAAYGGGLLLAFCGYWITLFSAGHAGWFMWMTFGVFAFGLVDRAVRKNKLKNWVLLPILVAWAGYQQQDLWLLFTAFTAIYFIWCCVRERKFPWKGALISLVVFVIFYIPGFQIGLDTLAGREKMIAESNTSERAEKGGSDDRSARWEFVTNWSLPASETIEFFIPRVNGDTSCPLVLSVGRQRGKDIKPYTGALGRPMNAREGNYRQHSLYVGFITCVLALLGIVSGIRHRQRETIFFTCAAVVFYLLSLGRYFAPAYRCIFALPVGDMIRCPVKWHHLTEFCLCVLAAHGIEVLAGCCKRFKFVPLVVVLLGVADLATEAARYCAPIDVSRPRRNDCGAQLSVLRRQDFANPQVAAALRAGKIISLANYLGNANLFLVEVLDK